MSIQIKGLTNPGSDSITDMKNLIDLCNDQDCTSYCLDIDDAFKGPDDINTFLLYDGDTLLSFMTLFTPTTNEAEVSAFTHPKARRKGLFKKLLEAVSLEVSRRGIPELLLVCDKNSVSGPAVAEYLGGDYDFSEYSMKFDRTQYEETKIDDKNNLLVIRPSLLSDKEELLNLSMITCDESKENAENYIESVFESDCRIQHVGLYNNKIVGMVSVYREPEKSYIHGLCVLPEYRKKGFGRQLLEYKVKEALDFDPDRGIGLEVQIGNIGALSIYENCGFVITACYDYYRVPVEIL